MIPDPSWLNAGDNAWQLTAATLVGLMSIPGLAILYGGVVQRKWAVNSALMAFYGFAMVLVVWVLWGFNMSFGQPWIQHGGYGFLGQPGAVLDHLGEQAQANIPLVSGIGAMPPFRFPQASLVYFQFVFAAITPPADPGQRRRPYQLQGLAALRPALVDRRLQRECLPALGRWFLGGAGGGRL